MATLQTLKCIYSDHLRCLHLFEIVQVSSAIACTTCFFSVLSALVCRNPASLASEDSTSGVPSVGDT